MGSVRGEGGATTKEILWRMVRVRFRISDTNVNHEIPIGPIIYNTEHIHQNDGVEVGDPTSTTTPTTTTTATTTYNDNGQQKQRRKNDHDHNDDDNNAIGEQRRRRRRRRRRTDDNDNDSDDERTGKR
jgi:hypothetical protein